MRNRLKWYGAAVCSAYSLSMQKILCGRMPNTMHADSDRVGLTDFVSEYGGNGKPKRHLWKCRLFIAGNSHGKFSESQNHFRKLEAFWGNLCFHESSLSWAFTFIEIEAHRTFLWTIFSCWDVEIGMNSFFPAAILYSTNIFYRWIPPNQTKYCGKWRNADFYLVS